MQYSISPFIFTICMVSLLLGRSLAQSDGDLRLVNGTTRSEGRVEMYYDTNWLAISNRTVGGKLSMVVCRQLGLPGISSETVVNAFGRDLKPRLVMIPNARCEGNEDRLSDCKGFDWNYQRIEEAHIDNDIGVLCKAGDGDLRLASGNTTSEGRVELYYDNKWTTITRGSVSSTNQINFARVVCRQLRLPFTEAQTVTNIDVFGEGRGEVMRAEISCTSSKSQLIDCKMVRIEVSREDFLHLLDIGVTCKGDDIASGDVRLVNGSDNRRGRLEIYSMGAWTSFCSIRFSVNEATVACRQLGINTSIPVVLTDGYYGSTRNRSYFTTCTGDERRMDHCPDLYLSSMAATWGDIYCGGSPDVSMCCLNEPGKCGYDTYPEFDVGGFISAFALVIFTITVFCCFGCCCCWCCRRNKRKQKYEGVSQNPPPQATGGTPTNQIPMAPVGGSDIPVYVHSPGQHTPLSGPAMGMPPSAPVGSNPYPSQPAPYPAVQVPPPAGAYPVPHQPGYNPAAAASMQYPVPYPPQTSQMAPPYGASSDYPHPQATHAPTGLSYPTKEDSHQPPLSHLQVGIPSAPPMDGGYHVPPLTPPPPYEEATSFHLEHGK